MKMSLFLLLVVKHITIAATAAFCLCLPIPIFLEYTILAWVPIYKHFYNYWSQVFFCR